MSVKPVADELVKRDKLSLDLFWIKDQSLTGCAALPEPGVPAEEIADELEAALQQFTRIAARPNRRGERRRSPVGGRLATSPRSAPLTRRQAGGAAAP